MKKRPTPQSAGSRRWVWLGAAGLLALALGVWIAVKPGAPPPRKAGPPVPETAEEPLRPDVPQPVARVARERPPPKRASSPPSPPPLPVAAPDDPEPPVADSMEAPPSDAPESQHGQGLEIRTLVKIGDLQLGLVGEAKVRDEQGLKAMLVQIGKDLEKSSQQLGGEAPRELQQLLDDYREELGQYMAGEVEVRGPNWMIGTEVGPAPPMREIWRPRPY